MRKKIDTDTDVGLEGHRNKQDAPTTADPLRGQPRRMRSLARSTDFLDVVMFYDIRRDGEDD
jgi:hypothetical protein